MSTTAPASPTPVRSSSSGSRRDTPSAQGDSSWRSQSSANRNAPPSSALPLRSNSVQQPGSRPPSSSRQAAQLANVVRRDGEQTDLSRPRSSSRRSSSENRYNNERQRAPQESPRGTQRSTSRDHQRYSRDAARSPTSQTNGVAQENGQRPVPAQPPPPQQARRRTTVQAQTGTWELGKTIGAGSMGKVKLARNRDTGETCAIKIVPRHSQEDHRSQQDRERADRSKEVRTQREAAIVTLVNHPFICGMRDVMRTNYHWYMLFEYVNGGQMLDYIISHGRLKEKQARKFARQIASALDYCHRNSIVHRDLKIENILISKTGDIKIIDFGLSNLFAPKSLLKTFCGSLYFAAPELLQAKQYTGPEVDVWSFGIVLYVLVCGKVPFDDQSMPQLHAKIKKGAVEYPNWLSNECRHIISRMLVTDPNNRATLAEILSHPWINKGFHSHQENFLPHREPLQLPLDSKVIEKMTGFDFGSPEFIRTQLENIINSDDYQRAVRLAARKNQSNSTDGADRRRSHVFDFYQRRKSNSSRDILANPSTDAVHLGDDPVNAFSPLLSIYYLVREKQEREKQETNPGALAMPTSPGEKPLKLVDLPAPEAAYTNANSYEMAGEATGGRTRPRARTNGEEDMAAAAAAARPPRTQESTTPVINEPPSRSSVKRESSGIGILRRFSTRRNRESEAAEKHVEKPAIPSPQLSVPVPEGSPSPQANRRSFSIRKTRDPPSAYKSVEEKHPDLLAPPATADENSASRRGKTLGRSTSVNSADIRRRWSRRGRSDAAEAKASGGTESERSSISDARPQSGVISEDDGQPRRLLAGRTRSVDHSRRSSLQTRRSAREKAVPGEEDVPEETDQELAEEFSGSGHADGSHETLKPVYLKGIFSVSTTSNKPLSVIRTDIIRVLKQLGVDFREMKGGFSCRHIPSIDLNRVVDNDNPNNNHDRSRQTQTHRRKISFAGLRSNDKDREDLAEQHQRPIGTPRSLSRRNAPESSYTTNSEEDSEEEHLNRGAIRSPRSGERAAGETTTQVQSDLGQSMILKFEILVVKIPIVSLHGLQFKKVDGGTWQYKRMAETILNELRL